MDGEPAIQRLLVVDIKNFYRVLDGGGPPNGIHIMTRNTIQRMAALPLSLAIVGIALMALATLPSSDAEQPVAQAKTAEVSVDAD